MFDIGWTEMLMVAVVAIIIIGPKDLPKALRTLGQWTGRIRAMAREFQNSIDEVVREAELDEIKKTVEQAGRYDIKGEIEKTIDPSGSLDGVFDMNNPAKKEIGQADEADKGKNADEEENADEGEKADDKDRWSKSTTPAHSLSPPADPAQPSPATSPDRAKAGTES